MTEALVPRLKDLKISRSWKTRIGFRVQRPGEEDAVKAGCHDDGARVRTAQSLLSGTIASLSWNTKKDCRFQFVEMSAASSIPGGRSVGLGKRPAGA